MSEKIYLDDPNVGSLEKQYLNDAIDSGYVSTYGPLVPKFEQNFMNFLGVENAVSVQSGTAALHMVLYELGIGPGDEVIVPALTFIASVNPIEYVGAQPKFVDIDINTWNIDPNEIERAINEDTKAIIPVHLYGNPCAMDEIMALAEKHDLFVIEDATESLGATYKGKLTGTFGHFGCFSFNGNKVITTGGGGMIVGSNARQIKHIRTLVNQAKDEHSDYYSEIGFNYRMTNIEAALGLAQIEKLPDFLQTKKQFKEIYKQELKDVKGLKFQEESMGCESTAWMITIIFSEHISVPELQGNLSQQGIPTRRVFMPVVEFPPYQKYRQQEYRNADYIYEHALCFPSATLNPLENIKYVCQTLKEIMVEEYKTDKVGQGAS